MYPNTGLEHMQTSQQAQQWFELADKDRSGKISETELQRVLANGQGETFSEKAVRLLMDMFGKEDRTAVNLNEFQALFNYVNAWLGVFKNYDKDNSGTISKNELAGAFSQMGYKLTPQFIDFLVTRFDKKNTDSITVDQFIVLCVQIQKFTEEFRKRDTNLTGIIEIGFEDFLTIALGCNI